MVLGKFLEVKKAYEGGGMCPEKGLSILEQTRREAKLKDHATLRVWQVWGSAKQYI